MESKSSLLEETCSSLKKTLESSRNESLDWKRKYEQILCKQKAANSEITLLKSRCSVAEEKLSVSQEQAKYAQKKAEEWERMYGINTKEVKTSIEKYSVVQKRAHKLTQEKEECFLKLTKKEEEIKENISKLEFAKQQVAYLNLKLREANNKIDQLEEEKIQLIESGKEKIATLEEAMDVRERELELILKSNIEQRKKMIQNLQSLLDIEKNLQVEGIQRLETFKESSKRGG